MNIKFIITVRYKGEGMSLVSRHSDENSPFIIDGTFRGEASKSGKILGKKKVRLYIENDPTNRFAVGIKDIFKSGENITTPQAGKKWDKNWVPLIRGDFAYKAEISSLAERLGKTKKEIVDAARDPRALNKMLNEKLIEYKRDLEGDKKSIIIYPIINKSAFSNS